MNFSNISETIMNKIIPNQNKNMTFMIIPEHGQPYNPNMTLMGVREHGQPYNSNGFSD